MQSTRLKNISTKALPGPSKPERDLRVSHRSLLVSRHAARTTVEISTHIHIITRQPHTLMIIPPRVGPKITAALEISI